MDNTALQFDGTIADAFIKTRMTKHRRQDIECNLTVINEAIEIETRDMERSKESIAHCNRLREIFQTIDSLAKEALSEWDKFQDGNKNLEECLKNLPGGKETFAQTIFSPLESYGPVMPKISKVFTCNERGLLSPYEQNIKDLNELREAFRIQLKIDDLCIEAEKEKPERRKPMIRELRRLYQQLTTCCPGILYKKFASPNVSKESTDMIYGLVKQMVDNAKQYVTLLKKFV